jgi:hypothetical protein
MTAKYSVAIYAKDYDRLGVCTGGCDRGRFGAGYM